MPVGDGWVSDNARRAPHFLVDSIGGQCSTKQDKARMRLEAARRAEYLSRKPSPDVEGNDMCWKLCGFNTYWLHAGHGKIGLKLMGFNRVIDLGDILCCVGCLISAGVCGVSSVGRRYFGALPQVA
jgi:hypothetical protein